MKIMTPELSFVAEITEAELPKYLAGRGLTTVRSGIEGTLIAFPESIKHLVNQAVAGTLPSVTYRDPEQLKRDVVTALRDVEVVVLMAGKNKMRQFFSTAGFCKLIEHITSEMVGVDLVMPPGAYAAHKHMAAWRRTASD